MASRAVNHMKSRITSGAGKARAITTSTVHDMNAHGLQNTDLIKEIQSFIPRKVRGDFFPVFAAVGAILLSMTCGMHTAKQHILYDPAVRVHKKRRETIPEVVEPDRVVKEADRLINKSLFRRVARIQDFDAARSHISDPTRGSTVGQPHKVVSLSKVGMGPPSI